MKKLSILKKNCPKLVISIILAAAFVPVSTQAQFLIVVSSKSSIDSLTTKQLQKVFKGQQVKIKNVNPCQVVEYAPVSDAFYTKLYGHNAYVVGKHWLRMIFSGERVLPPKSFSDIKKFVKFLTEHDNAIGFLSLELFRSSKEDSLRAIVIDGRSYKHPQYSLR
ncbi:MAG: hypothetical protein ACE5HO_17880 [bacterium]